MNNDLVSIIMPSYNCGKYVEETIRSVQAQTYQNWEIIFVDDCSPDDTVKLVSELLEKDSRGKLLKKDYIFRAVELIEEARRDLIMNVNYNYALRNLMLKIGG